MSEYFDVLDENGDYTGKVETRENCHKEGIVHKAVAAFIINSKNQVLLQKRSKSQKMWPDMWDLSSGGHVDSGEFGFQAITREIKEELGIEVNKNEMTFIGASFSTNIKKDIVNKHINEYYIINKDVDETKLELQKEEVSEVKWIDKDEIIKRVKNNCDGITDKGGAWNYLVKYYEWLENN
jgi:8-oxo-dGTP diphosphatase